MAKVIQTKNQNVYKFVRLLNSIAPEKNRWQVFEDWAKCGAISLSNVGHYSQKYENEYLETIKAYNELDRMKFAKMLAVVVDGMEESFCDFLGEAYMSCDMGNGHLGQFFTPYDVSLASAKMTISDKLDNNRIYSFAEPSCGSGGMIVACAEVLRDKGFPFQRNMIAYMGDIDITAVHMAVIQCSILGIPAVISHQNSLTCETWRTYETPAVGMSFVLERWENQKAKDEKEKIA